MKSKILAVLLLSVIPTACASERVIIAESECPLFPELIVIDEEMEAATPPLVREAVLENYILLIEWGEKLELRANCVE